MNKILAALNHSSVQIEAAESGSRKDALYLLNKVKKGIESSDCPQDIKEWFTTALSQILESLAKRKKKSYMKPSKTRKENITLLQLTILL